ncbi:HET-domain-containing protein, partial [Stipitochalara longipes BDJ]
MRLLNVYTNKLEEFFSPVIPKYAILSHRWGSKEVTFQDLNAFDSQDWESTAVKRAGPGLMKIVYTCLQAKKEDLGYIWVDTCCIDKSSSAELSEAINSMYTYYQGSDVCYAYLDDVRDLDHSGADQADFTSSKWFTRGWTLQELLAPSKLRFFGINWKFLGDRTNLSRLVSLRTSIPEEIVKDPSYVRSTSIANRMSWAADRQTTRVEDVAYSLLGIFNVNMPLLYGEGEKAFIRLQEEIIRGSDDQSIFAWEWNKEEAGYAWFSGPLANSPARFRKSGNIIPLPSNAARQPYTMTNKGLRIETDLTAGTPPVAILECHYDNDFSGLLGIRL